MYKSLAPLTIGQEMRQKNADDEIEMSSALQPAGHLAKGTMEEWRVGYTTNLIE